ncbi:uncharacterized protein MONOS_16186 [Monocercomonoides exilis]|uniref:uncharacterized protein n=1 Tax=Monocercomonoides exilis TaxID=2049356 RepID=UPI00355AB5E8|nr:hypothetical protein MONOS_16186 [Monocercomonoides exilis]|eukprot:MONOS_16186.1-p1 / transcript=MONOS_16186.1 / gene=MONOS_16186 / organism=Monocercomonoides_exilis_PA203 / gene_product=unspecified product / transcript_product=unspecified product / location=Mono_scaffold01552:9319-9750(-) / protein_length=125 / sequence_SO=supercontig / SO=protein_coding / is_pseudo=false
MKSERRTTRFFGCKPLCVIRSQVPLTGQSVHIQWERCGVSSGKRGCNGFIQGLNMTTLDMFKLTSCVADALEKEKIIRPNEIVIVEQTQCMSLEEEVFEEAKLDAPRAANFVDQQVNTAIFGKF